VDFRLTEEQQMIRDMAAKFSDDVIAPRAEEMVEVHDYPYDITGQMSDLGMMGIPFPEKYGGSGGDWIGMCLCIEEISRGDAGLGGLLDVTVCDVANELYEFGTEEQKQKWLVPMAQGKTIGAYGLTEPQAGSDAAATKTTAVLDGDEWVINGTKQFISNIAHKDASLVIITAITREKDKNVLNTFIVPKGTPGFDLGQEYDKIALHHFPTYELVFEDCRISKDLFLGEEGRGFAQHLTVLAVGRIGVAAVGVGMAQACLNASLKYAKERVQFGRPIFSFQGVSFKLADMAMNIELARNMYLKAAWLRDNNMPYNVAASCAKLFAAEKLERIASDAFQIHGGYGFMKEYAVSRYYMGAKIMQIIEGTNEVQRVIISRSLK
jgi:alkylation response protein AidB-like acyl-CoA dehydrogenase